MPSTEIANLIGYLHLLFFRCIALINFFKTNEIIKCNKDRSDQPVVIVSPRISSLLLVLTMHCCDQYSGINGKLTVPSAEYNYE